MDPVDFVYSPLGLQLDLPLVLGAGGSVSPLVGDLGLCLVAAGVLAIAFVKLKIPAIAALLGAGVLLGPAGLEAIQDRASIETIANLGLTLLLFVIGLEVNLQSLLASGRTLVVTGLVQVPLTLAAGCGAFLVVGLSGWGLVSGVYPALYLGVACAFSSTLLVVKYLQEHLQLDTVAGRLAVGLLIFQDIWAIVFLALQPSFAHPSIAPILLTFLGTAILATIATLVARLLLSRAFHVVARSPELVVTLALGWCFGVGLFGANLGTVTRRVGLPFEISVSMEMGALIAGATIATSPYAYEVVSRVVHLRDFFVTLFFVGLGMSIPVPERADVIVLAAIVAAIAIVLRYAVFLPVLYATGLDRRNSVSVSTKLAQVSEFCLVIVYLGSQLGHVSGTVVSVVIFAFVITALATPLLFAASDRLYRRLRPLLDLVGIRSRGLRPEVESAEAPRLVLLGFHRIGSALLADLERLHADLIPRTLVVDTNSTVHDEIRRRGAQVLYGDIASVEVLRHAGVDAAEVIVCTVPDELLKGTTNAQLVQKLRQLAPKAAIIATSTRVSEVSAVRAAGADHVYRPPTEVALGVLPAIYAALNASLPSYLEALEEEHGTLEARREVID
ncbi:MAG TPA: cation:proton antiporter [Kofleriaceae bacterium]|nr:cation:proton antiporter [Kofleriaceae bacterium]